MRWVGWLLLLAVAACSDSFVGRVVGVTDGDTISVLRGGRAVKVRLEAIDAPEKGQDFSNVARRYLSSMVFEKDVRVVVSGRDRYGRLLGRVFVDGEDVSLAMVSVGLAWHYKQFSSEEKLAVAEQEARSAMLGLWSQPATPPWEWRAGAKIPSLPPRAASPPLAPTTLLAPDTCGEKRFCREMRSCAEAEFYLRQCGLTRLDGDNDGIPCESLCR